MLSLDCTGLKSYALSQVHWYHLPLTVRTCRSLRIYSYRTRSAALDQIMPSAYRAWNYSRYAQGRNRGTQPGVSPATYGTHPSLDLTYSYRTYLTGPATFPLPLFVREARTARTQPGVSNIACRLPYATKIVRTHPGVTNIARRLPYAKIAVMLNYDYYC